MAKFVGAFGVPHTPMYAQLVNREGAGSETGGLFAQVRDALAQAAPDVLIMFDTDHLNTFFLDNLPTLGVGVAESFRGPIDEPPELPVQSVPSHAGLAGHVFRCGVRDGFDLALVQEFAVDHSVMIPLHFLTPGMTVPVIPVFVNGHVPPLPSAERVYRLGQSVRRAIESFADALRVAVIGSGSFSLEVYGPRIIRGLSFGVPDPAWAARVQAHLQDGTVAALLGEATEERMLAAGNVAGELLDWIAMLGTLGTDRGADWIRAQPTQGHAYAVWREGAG